MKSIKSSFMILRRVVLLMRLCPMPNGHFRALLDGGGNLIDGDLLSGGPTSPGDLLLATVPKLRNFLTHFCTNLLPGASFSCRSFKLKFDRNHRLVFCSDVVKMYVSTKKSPFLDTSHCLAPSSRASVLPSVLHL